MDDAAGWAIHEGPSTVSAVHTSPDASATKYRRHHVMCLQVYQDLCKKHPTFRERSENADLAVRQLHRTCSCTHDACWHAGMLQSRLFAMTLGLNIIILCLMYE